MYLKMYLNKNTDAIMKHYDNTIKASVKPSMQGGRVRLYNFESGTMEWLMTMEFHGGINFRINRRRELKVKALSSEPMIFKNSFSY